MKKPSFRLTPLGLALGGLFGVAYPALSDNTDIASEPLSQAASGVKPNVMFILDDSGSMAWDYSPDYINDFQPSGGTPSTTASCFDAGDVATSGVSGQSSSFTADFDDSAGSISGRPDHCIPGDPPYMSPDINKQYYNPAISYRPGVDSTGVEKTEMTSTNTAVWTAVPTDPYGVQDTNQLLQTTTTVNLVTGYPDRAWCKTTADAVAGPDCVVNSAYSYPDATYSRGLNTTTTGYGSGGGGSTYNNVKYRYGLPYYYRMQTAQWCTSAARSTCVSGSSVDPNVHTFIAAEFCSDSELTNCAAGTGVTLAHTFSGPRFCSDQNTLLTCQRKKVGNFRWPKHLGVVKTATVAIPAAAATGTITVTSASVGAQITAITINSVPIISGSITAGGTSTITVADQIRAAINAHVSAPDYTATVSGSVVTITAATIGAGENGKSISVSATSTGLTSATATITVNSGGSNDIFVEEIRVNHPSPSGWINIMATNCTGSFGGNVATLAGGLGRRIRADTGTNSSAERIGMANAIQSCVDQRGALSAPYAGQVFDATWSGSNTLVITAPASLGATMTGRGVQVIASGDSPNFNAANFVGGTSSTIATTNSGSLSGGAAASSGTMSVRAGVGQFSRVNIDPANNVYPKSAARVDCGGTVCSYDEEMTNFANWYSYYRTRMQMMKSASGRAFVPIDSTFRVGFITINYSSSAEYLKVDDYTDTHKSNWYTKFYDTVPGSGTPLRVALSRVGQMYAGKAHSGGIPAADDPVQYSCQPNFAILSTDGYWNGGGGADKDNSGLTNQDNTDTAPYSRRTDGVYDGAPSSPTVGLADVALYYYKTDLRPAGTKNYGGTDVSADNVPTTAQDFASHQHMTTFTLGLGLDGELTYRSDYQTATAGDFLAIKQGTKNWPNPVADAPSALDDLWHAAVNGRGVFFSASNPQELANSLSDTLDALKKRVGAGAAAATSNLQPVAGDNFAFTAQYETQVWVGDLKARTIDLSSGAISTIELWSAQSKLNAMLHTQRIIYTYDPADTYNPSSTGAVGNQLKHFCHSSSAGTSPWCNDGTGLPAGEEAYFNPNRLVQYVSLDDTTQKPNATALNLINYLRGHQTYEDQGIVGPTDLFRDRAALLGDVINAQPSYVKASPFNYNDTGYQDFKKCTLGTATVTCPGAQFPTPTIPRRPTVYIASNDGMLHAIETDVNNSPYYQTAGISTPSTSDDAFSAGNNNGNGVERWAYIPGIVLPDLYQLANIPYHHEYLVDGSPTVGDVCISTPCTGIDDWRTMLVAGLNAGGRGFYALDITNPLKPRAMWEFKVRNPSVTACSATIAAAIGDTDDCDLGLSFGNPVITKLKSSGQWVVIVSSGLNNTGVEPATTNRRGDGKGYLYVLNALNGQIIQKIPTNVGEPGTAGANYVDAAPSGLGKINNWVDNSLTDNTTLAVYGGDLLGNLWRFDLDDSSATYLTAVKVAALTNASSEVQPITTKPELGLISNRRVIFVGTGKFLGTSDKSTSEVQTIYAIADDLSSSTTLTGRTGLKEQVIGLNSPTTRIVTTPDAPDWTLATDRGWFIDLPDSGERVNVDPQLQLGTLVVASNVPSTDTCVAGGTAWINTLDFRTGGYVAGATGNSASQRISGSVAVGINVIQLPGGKVVTIVTTADNQQLPVDTPVAPTTFQGRRVGWRELTGDQ